MQGIRVEVNGQVLSQGGDVAADQLTDTTSALPVRQNPAFLPAAVIVGLVPGEPLNVRNLAHEMSHILDFGAWHCTVAFSVCTALHKGR